MLIMWYGHILARIVWALHTPLKCNGRVQSTLTICDLYARDNIQILFLDYLCTDFPKMNYSSTSRPRSRRLWKFGELLSRDHVHAPLDIHYRYDLILLHLHQHIF